MRSWWRHLPVRFHRPQRDGVDERGQRRVVSVRPDFLRDVPAVGLQLGDGARPNEAGLKAVSPGDVAPDLRLVHRLRCGQAAELPHVNQRDKDNRDHEQDATNPDRDVPVSMA